MLTRLLFIVSALVVVHSETDDSTLLARAHNQFTVDLLKGLATENSSSIVFFSLTSIAAAFGMAYVGARGGSESELNSVFGHTDVGLTDRSRLLTAYKNLLELSASPNVTLDVANTVLPQDRFPISDSYKQQLREIFDADMRSANFVEDGPRMTAEVSAWVREKTRGTISGILPEGQPLAIVLFILNAVYFKGTWVTKFDAHRTINKPFLNLRITEASKPAMHLRTRFLYARVDSLHASALEIPYEGDWFTMVVLLPDSATKLTALRNGLSLVALEDVSSRLSFRNVILKLPKFGKNLSYNLVPAMRAIGLNSVFGGSADFSGKSEAVPLAISDVRHRAAVEVNEEGTIATAVAGLDIVAVSAQLNRSPPIEFTVDHPFIFYVRDRSTNRVLVIGEVNTL